MFLVFISEEVLMMKQVLRAVAEEPEQRCQPDADACLVRHEKIRLGVLCGSLLIMLLGFVFFVATKGFLPLFFAIVLAFFSYKCLDAVFEHSEQVLLHPQAHDHSAHMQTSQAKTPGDG
jgi:hypothetical protein